MIRLSNIHKSYVMAEHSLHVLKGIDLHVKEGEFVSIMGSSGSGKSTLLNIIGILDDYDTGEYYLNDVYIRDLVETKAAYYRNQFLGFVFQSFNLIPFKNAVSLSKINPEHIKQIANSMSQRKSEFYIVKYVSQREAIETGTDIVNKISKTFDELIPAANFLGIETEKSKHKIDSENGMTFK